jgi:hypothetical protein
MSFPFLLSRRTGSSAATLSTNVKKDAMQALCAKSRKKGSRKRTCPKVDMPKSRQVLCALLNAYACGSDSRTHITGPWPPWPQNRPIRMVAVTDCAPSIDPRNRLSA